ncbi:extracellular solute-binding protein [Clostridia bacterium OttesenSCG-928-F22]|nr:extracellular solute-binding protein [Clostridia bacterium OttesenSCG-928-F22]
MKRFLAIILLVSMALLTFAGCSGGNAKDNKVVIYASTEEYRNEYYAKRLKEKFPDYTVSIEYMSSGNQAAKLLAEGTSSEGDISIDLEYGYVDKLSDVLADLSSYDYSIYAEDMLLEGKKVIPWTRNGGCIVVNPAVLASKNLEEPKTYEDLLKPEYKGLISMPSPKSSGTGYMFVKSLVNAWGEEEAFDYFDKLSANILHFTSSGSGPVNDLVKGETAIGLGMIAQTVTEINNGVDLKMLFFEEGAPYSTYGIAMVKGKEQKKAVKEVFDFFVSDLLPEDKERFYPEKVLKDKDFVIENYPTNIKYADMSNNTASEKERLLEKWKY